MYATVVFSARVYKHNEPRQNIEYYNIYTTNSPWREHAMLNTAKCIGF